MAKYSPAFRNILQFTAEKSLQHREPTLAETDPTLAAELDLERTSREVWGEWGSNKKIKVFSGYVDEGGEEMTIPLLDGQKAAITYMGHLNVDYKGGPFVRHILDASGVVYRDLDDDRYTTMPDLDIEQLIKKLKDI